MKFSLPDKKFLGGFAVGILWGVVMAFIAGALFLRHALILEYECKGGVDETVAKILENSARLPAWKVQQVPCAIPTTAEGGKIAGLRLCNVDYAKQLLESPGDRRIAAAIPCGVAVYGKPDGKTYLAKVNMPLLGRILGGAPAQLFPNAVAPEQNYLLSGTLKVK